MRLEDARREFLDRPLGPDYDEQRLPVRRIEVLDHGYVEIDSWLGSDRSIVAKARKSTGGENKSDLEDRRLINYLIRNRHTSPVEMGVLIFDIKMPIFVARQWFRHRTHAANEYSGRYSAMSDEMYLPEVERFQVQATDNRQGSGEPLSEQMAYAASHAMRSQQLDDRNVYRDFLSWGMSRELARINLPLSQYTSFYWQQNLHNLLHLLHLRTDPHAQWEIRQYAEAIEVFVRLLYPWVYEAWVEHVRDAVTLSATEAEVLVNMWGDHALMDYEATLDAARVEGARLSKNQIAETLRKLRRYLDE